MSSPGGPEGWGPREHGQPRDQNPGSPSGMRYQGFGIYDQNRSTELVPFPDDPTPRKKRGPIIAFAALAAALVIGAITTVVLVTNPGDDQAKQPPPGSSSVPAEESSEAAEAPAPLVPGWQAVKVPKRSGVYDVPSRWSVEPSDYIVGFGPPEDRIGINGVAVYRKGFCANRPDSYRAIAGATARQGADDADVASATARKLAHLAYTVNGKPPHVVLGPPQQVSLDEGAATGTLVTATVAHPAPGPCDSPEAFINVLARGHDGNGSIVHIAMAEQGFPGALPPEAMKTISLSFRPLD